MAKSVIMHKVIISYEDGEFLRGVGMYYIQEDGVVEEKAKTIEVSSGLDAEEQEYLDTLLANIKTYVETLEGIE